MKRRIAAIVFAIAFVFAGTIGVSAEYAEVTVSDCGGLWKGVDGLIHEWPVGSTTNFQSIDRGFYVKLNVKKESLYQLSVDFTISPAAHELQGSDYKFGITNTFPSSESELSQVNSSGISYYNFFTYTVTRQYVAPNSYYHFDLFFSTAEDAIDNLVFGENYVSLIFDNYASGSFTVTNVSVTAIAYEDVQGDLFQDLVIQHITNIDNNIYNIYSYGQGNTLPQDPGIGAAQENLHNAESTLKNKQQSLFSRASDGITTAITASQTHVSSLAAPVAAVASNVGTAMAQLPSEVQAGFVAMPLVGLAAWLIGLKR